MAGPDQASPHIRAETLTLNNGGTSGALAVTGGAAIDTLTLTNAIVAPAAARPVYTGVKVLTAADNGALCVWNAAAGHLYTLPAAATGLWFDFVVGITITSVGAKVITASGDFLLGGFIQSTDSTYTSAYHAANGTDIVSWNGNGTTTGGLAGDWFRVVAISASQWQIWGMGRATGSEASPFATS